jgi:hypothetical protein
MHTPDKQLSVLTRVQASLMYYDQGTTVFYNNAIGMQTHVIDNNCVYYIL